jgi:hypothetical protein
VRQADAIADDWASQASWVATDDDVEVVVPPTAVPAAELPRFVARPSRLPSQPQ